MSAFDAVLFDLDGTLCERTQNTDALYATAFDRVGIEPFGEPAALWDALEGPPDHDDWVGYIGAGFAQLAAQHGRTAADPLALAAALEDAVDDTAVTRRPGTTHALEAAASLGPIGIVTNGPQRTQETKLEALGLTDRFDVVIYGADLPRKKPHTVPFDRALLEIDKPAETVLYVGNSLRYDVAGAQNAGLPAAWLSGPNADPGAYTPEYSLDSLTGLPAILENPQQ